MKLRKFGFQGITLLVILLITCFVSCDKDKEDDDNPGISQSVKDSANLAVSAWIYDWMHDVYFWNNTFPSSVSTGDKTDPEAFFYELVYETEDKWSYITSDYITLHSELSGNPVSMGYSPAFGLFTNTNKVFILVEYVYPNSPADVAGLKRGDIILTIDGEAMDTSNYYELFSLPSYEAGLGFYANNSIYSSSKTISLTATTINADPLIYDTIFSKPGNNIGYIVYTEFITGTDNKFLATLDTVFDHFRNSGINGLIVDLRYNPGGQIEASTHLASAIAPASVVSNASPFVTFKYNSLLQSYYESEEGAESENLVCKFPANAHNVNLSRVCFLTTNNTASASELLIIGLRPYMNVTVVGEPTYGKYTGMWLIYDTDTPPRHNWAIMPVVMKYANAQGYTDFKNGLMPDFEMNDNLIEAKPFGNTGDPMLAAALEQMAGVSLKSAGSYAKPVYKRLDDTRNKLKRNLIIPNTLSSKKLTSH